MRVNRRGAVHGAVHDAVQPIHAGGMVKVGGLGRFHGVGKQCFVLLSKIPDWG